MTGPAVAVSVVVVNWNGGDLLQDCLRSLTADAEADPALDVEILLVDNASTDGSPDRAVDAFPSVRLLRRADNGGFAAGVNAGIEASAGDFVVLVNNDAVVRPGFLAAITAPMIRPGSSDVAAVTGRVVLAGRYLEIPRGDAPPTALSGLDGTRWVRVHDDADGMRLLNSTGNVQTVSGNGGDRDWLSPEDSPPAPEDVFGFNGGCAALRRAALTAVGPFDARLFMYFEDTELSWRLRRGGWRIVHAHDAVTEHQHAASSGTATAFFQILNARNRLIVAVAQAPWPVVGRAWARTIVRCLRGPGRAHTARALARALASLPRAVATRFETDRRATVSRAEVARWLVPDGRPTARPSGARASTSTS